jgi:predicted transcriptional regulator
MLPDVSEFQSIAARERRARAAKVIAALSAGHSQKEVAAAVGLSKRTVQTIASAHGLVAHRERPWTKSEDAVVRSLYGKKGGAASIIARKLKRTRNEVIGRAYRMGLSKPACAEKVYPTLRIKKAGEE